MTVMSEWMRKKSTLIEALAQAANQQAAQSLRPQYTELLQLFQAAVAAQAALNQKQGCLGFVGRLVSLSSLDTLSLSLGVGGVILSNSEAGKDYPWMHEAGLVLIALSQVFSKWNDVRAYKARVQAQNQNDYARIIGEATFLNLVKDLLNEQHSRSSRVSTWEKKRVDFLVAVQEPSAGHHISLPFHANEKGEGEGDQLLVQEQA